MEVKDTARYGLFCGGDMIHYGTMEEMLAKGKEMASDKADVCYTISSLTFVGDEPREGVRIISFYRVGERIYVINELV